MRFKLGYLIYCFVLLILATVYSLWHHHNIHTQAVDDFEPAPVLQTQTLADRMSQRLQLVRQVCQHYGIDTHSHGIVHPPAPQYSVFYFNRKNGLAYCPIYKAASTSMLHWLLNLAGVSGQMIRQSSKQISDQARQYYPSIDYPLADKLLEQGVKVMIVRHPFERLLSAYRDKLEDSTKGLQHGTGHYYEKYGRKIVSKYRAKMNETITKREPTFAEFAQYIIDTNLNAYADDHWIPFYLYCTPCLVRYDFIVKFETFHEDMRLLVERLGVDSAPAWMHMTRGGQSAAKIDAYFSTLSRRQVQLLYDKFAFDFQLFNYTIAPFIRS